MDIDMDCTPAMPVFDASSAPMLSSGTAESTVCSASGDGCLDQSGLASAGAEAGDSSTRDGCSELLRYSAARGESVWTEDNSSVGSPALALPGQLSSDAGPGGSSCSTGPDSWARPASPISMCAVLGSEQSSVEGDQGSAALVLPGQSSSDAGPGGSSCSSGPDSWARPASPISMCAVLGSEQSSVDGVQELDMSTGTQCSPDELASVGDEVGSSSVSDGGGDSPSVGSSSTRLDGFPHSASSGTARGEGSGTGQRGWKRRSRLPSISDERSHSIDRVPALEAAFRGFATRKSEVVVEPAIGTVFDSIAEAYEFYNLYSWESGFGIRYGRSRQNVSGTKCMQEIVCGCSGKPVRENSASVMGQYEASETTEQSEHLVTNIRAPDKKERGRPTTARDKPGYNLSVNDKCAALLTAVIIEVVWC